MTEQILAEGIETYHVKNGAFCIVMNPNTGAIYAMASTPDFDPNSYRTILDEATKAQLEALGFTVLQSDANFLFAKSDRIGGEALYAELKKRGITHLKVVYSEERAVPRAEDAPPSEESGTRRAPGSMPYVPGVAGLLIAGEVIRDLTRRT